jgi:hypothetical protein
MKAGHRKTSDLFEADSALVRARTRENYLNDRIVFDCRMASGHYNRRRFLHTFYFGSRQSIDQFHEAGVVRITNGGLATWLHPFGMLEPQVVVNLLPKLGISAHLVRHGYMKVFLTFFGFSPMRSHSGRSLK